MQVVYKYYPLWSYDKYITVTILRMHANDFLVIFEIASEIIMHTINKMLYIKIMVLCLCTEELLFSKENGKTKHLHY